MKIDKSVVILLAVAVMLMAGVFIAWPYTDMGKQSYETKRQNAINYISSVQNDPMMMNNESCQQEVQRLIKKYNLGDIQTNLPDLFKDSDE